MPNGTYRSAEEWAEIKSFFEAISEPLKSFASEHNLVIDKYYHDGADWTFRFAHPLGGYGQLSVMRTDASLVWLGLGWYVDDYDNFTRSLKNEIWKDIVPDPKQLSSLLERALRTIVRWRLGDWDTIAGGYEYPWGQRSKQEWERLNPTYPLPILNDGS